MSDWFELLPVVQRTVYVRGVPSKAKLVQIQPAGEQPYIGRRPAQYLESTAAWAWVQMHKAAADDGIELIAYSAFRNHAHQTRLRKEWKAWHDWHAGGEVGPEPKPARELRPARPGFSLHESAKAVDILRSHDDPDAGGPLIGPTDIWLAENAHRFGFFRTVPKELWHYEFRGVT